MHYLATESSYINSLTYHPIRSTIKTLPIGPLGGPILAGTEVHGPATSVRGVVLNYINARVINSLEEAEFYQWPFG